MNKQYELTLEGLQKIKDELENLKNVEKPANIIALQEARAQGDLSENADYDAARNDQARIESRIVELETILKNHVITKATSAKEVRIGTTVTFIKTGSKKEITYQIVGSIEADPFENKISNESPFGRAIEGARENDKRKIKTDKSEYEVKIVSIKLTK